jgi:hypothetical protein
MTQEFGKGGGGGEVQDILLPMKSYTVTRVRRKTTIAGKKQQDMEILI